MSTGKSPGISGFFKDKINDFKGMDMDSLTLSGVDPEKSRQARLSKLGARIEEVFKLSDKSSSKKQLKQVKRLRSSSLTMSWKKLICFIKGNRWTLRNSFEIIQMLNWNFMKKDWPIGTSCCLFWMELN